MTRLPAQRVPAIGFAHRGASAHARENTIEAFSLALRLGATGLESDVWVTADGVPVLDHDGVTRRFLRRTPISRLTRAELPGHIPTLGELYEAVGPAVPLSLDVKDPNAFEATVAAAAAHGALATLWLVHPDLELLAQWRSACGPARLVHSIRLSRVERPELHAAALRDAGIHTVNMHHSDWSGGLCAMYHRFEREAFAWDAQQPRILDELLDAGLDAVYSDHADRLADALTKAYPAAA